jgi:putative membrane protein
LSDDDDLDPRLRYANERTFLAWIRTSLALMTAGLAIAQLLPAFNVPGGRRIIGLPLIALGIWASVAAFRQWVVNDEAMAARRTVERSRLPIIVAVGVAVVSVVALVIAAFGQK